MSEHRITVKYPGLGDEYWEILGAKELVREVQGTVYELTSHASFIPLGPGDIVVADQNDVVKHVESIADVYTYELTFHLPADLPPFATPSPEHRAVKAVTETLEGWAQHAAVTRETNFTAFITSPDHKWLDEHVLKHRYVNYAEPIRTPHFQFDLAVAIRHPDLDGTRSGPYA